MDSWTLIILIGGIALVILDVFIPSGGLLSGLGIAALIERGLDALGVAAPVRWPLAGLGMLVTVGVVIRFGERMSETLFPARVRTNTDRMVGLPGRVVRQTESGYMVEIEGDFWTVRVEGTTHLEPGQAVVVTAFADQTPTVRVQAPT